MWCTACAGDDGLERVATRVLLCLWCREEIAGLRVVPCGKRPGLYKYEGTMRALIIRAKVQGDGAALRVLRHLLRTHPHGPVLEKDVVVVPCPSSMWSRLRGRVDVAAIMADELGPVASPPWALLWRLRKRASQSDRSNADPLPDLSSYALRRIHAAWLRAARPSLKGRTVLIVDDVTTTGHTLRAMRAALAAAEPCDIRALTLAQARFD